MELRQLRYFVAVAEELHFSRAAARLHLAQPALSQQIRRLEGELGLDLFARTTRAVELTDAGRALFEEARAVLAHAERIETAARERADPQIGQLRLGASAPALSAFVPSLVAAFHDRLPTVTIELHEDAIGEPTEALRAGTIDVAVARAPLRGDDLASELLLDEPIVAVLAAEHPLAAGTSLPLADLAEEPFVLFPRPSFPALHDELVESCQRHGFTPLVAQSATSTSAALALVAAGMGVTLMPASVAGARPAGVAVAPIEPPAPRARHLVAWRRGDESPTVYAFRQTARELGRAWELRAAA